MMSSVSALKYIMCRNIYHYYLHGPEGNVDPTDLNRHHITQVFEYFLPLINKLKFVIFFFKFVSAVIIFFKLNYLWKRHSVLFQFEGVSKINIQVNSGFHLFLLRSLPSAIIYIGSLALLMSFLQKKEIIFFVPIYIFLGTHCSLWTNLQHVSMFGMSVSHVVKMLGLEIWRRKS